MNMRRKGLICGVLTALLFTIAAAFCACKSPDPVEITGFESIQSEMTAKSGAIVEIPMPVVTDSNGNIVDVWVEVVDSKGGYVAVSENTFAATDVGGYTIRYVAKTSDGVMHTATTLLKVSQSAFTFEVEGFTEGATSLFTVGETVVLNAHGPEGATYSYALVRNAQTTELAEGEFAPAESGKYTIRVTAALNDAREVNEYDIYVRNKSKIGEVEIFDENWAEIAKINGDARLADWSIVSTADGAPEDRNGESATYLSLSAGEHTKWIDFPISPRNNAEYYKSLAQKGYTDVVAWVYLDCEYYHEGNIRTDPNGRYYQRSFPAIKPKTWTAISFNLSDRKNVDEDSYRSFITCLEAGMYDGQKMQFMTIDNSGEYNSRSETGMKVYVGDIYAVRNWEMRTGDDLFLEKSAGGTYTVDKNAFDTAGYGEDFDFIWRLDGAPVGEEIEISSMKCKKQPLELYAVGKDSHYEDVVYRSYIDVYDRTEIEDTAKARQFAEDRTQITGSALEGWYKGNARTEYFDRYEERSNVVKVSGSQTSLGALINPLHSGRYYRELINAAGEKTYYYTFDYKIVSKTIHARYNFEKEFNKDWVSDVWYTETVELTKLLDYVDEMAQNFSMANAYPSGNFDALLVGVYNNGIATDIYVTMPKIIAVEALEEIEGTVKLASKTATSVSFEDFDAADYADYNLTWYINGEETESIDPSVLEQGIYEINVYAAHKIYDISFPVYKTKLDVYEDGDTTFVKSAADLIASDLANWDDGRATTSVESEKYNGKTVVKGAGSKATFGVTANPLHTREYYETLLAAAKAQGIEYYLVYSYKIAGNSGCARYDYAGKEYAAATWTVNTWYTESVKLSDLISCIEEMRYTYAHANAFKGLATRRTGLLSGVYNNYSAMQIYVTVPELVAASSIQITEDGVKLVNKSQKLNFGDLFDTADYAGEFDFIWKIDGAAVTNLNPSAYAEGLHAVEAIAKNKVSGVEATAYRATLDIYDENAFTLVKSLNDVIGVRSFAGWGTSVENIHGATYDNKEVVKIQSKGETRFAMIADLAHSYEYYEYLVSNGKNYNVSMECYIPSTANANSWSAAFNYKGAETNRANSLKGAWKENEWVTITISLSDFLGQVKGMKANYADAVSHASTVNGNAAYRYGANNNSGQFFGFYLPYGGDTFTMYMAMPVIAPAD